MNEFTPYMLSFRVLTEGLVGSRKTKEDTLSRIRDDLHATYGVTSVTDIELRELTDEEKEEYATLLVQIEDPIDPLKDLDDIFEDTETETPSTVH